MNWGAIAIVVVYLLVTMLLPLYTAKKNTVTNTDYTVGGRQFGTLFVFFTLLSTAVSKSYREAWECFEIVEKYPTSSKIVNYEQLGILYLILKLSGDELNSYIDKVLQPLLEYDAQKNAGLMNTLQAYINFNKNIKYVAEYLNVHYNTAYWRVRKAERLLQQDFDSTQDWFNIQAACMLYGIIHKNSDY